MIEKVDLFENLAQLKSARVLCIGDVMLDRFVYGGIDRISPEAPIPVLLVEREKHMLGGAGNVVANLATLGATVTLLSAVGADDAGKEIRKYLEAQGVTAALEIANDRTTTVKSRFVCGSQQMLRVDREKTEAITAETEAAIIAQIDALVKDAGAVILSDYKKGLLTDKIVRAAIDSARAAGVPVIVDPKGRDFTRYNGASFVTPNRKELETATGLKAATNEEVEAAARLVMQSCGIENALVTRSKDGMSLVTSKNAPVHIPAQVREVYDVSGAGDTVIAVFAAGLAAGVPVADAATLANIAAGIVVGKSGTATARPDEIAEIIENDIIKSRISVFAKAPKVATVHRAAEQAERLRARGLKVGFTNGCFDLLHPGHLSSLRQARAACDFLIVAINGDASVKRLKGPTRPVQNQDARAEVLSALDMVDMVLVFEEDTPLSLIEAIRPDVLVKGGQYKLEEVVGYDVVMSYGGKIVRADMEDGFSTTNTIAKMSA